MDDGVLDFLLYLEQDNLKPLYQQYSPEKHGEGFQEEQVQTGHISELVSPRSPLVSILPFKANEISCRTLRGPLIFQTFFHPLAILS